jgi:hypothetical protein
MKIHEISSRLASAHYDNALKYLERIKVPDERKIPLIDFTKDLMNREK